MKVYLNTKIVAVILSTIKHLFEKMIKKIGWSNLLKKEKFI